MKMIITAEPLFWMGLFEQCLRADGLKDIEEDAFTGIRIMHTRGKDGGILRSGGLGSGLIESSRKELRHICIRAHRQ